MRSVIGGGDAVSAHPEQPSWFVCLLDGPDHQYVYVNEAYQRSFGSHREFLGRTVQQVLPELAGQGFFENLDQVYKTGEAHHGQSAWFLGDVDDGGPIARHVEFSCSAVLDKYGCVTHVMVEGRLWGPPRLGQLSPMDRARNVGARSLSDPELLSAFLDDDGEERSRVLLRRFGSLRGVCTASPADLQQLSPGLMEGDGRALHPGSVLRLRIAHELQRRVLLQRVAPRALLHSSRILHAYLKVQLADEPREQFRVIFLDAGLKLIADEKMGEGSITQVAVYSREVLRRALELSAQSLLLVHNHPAGGKTVSAADLGITDEIIAGADVLNIEVHDHLIVAGDTIVSLRSLHPMRFKRSKLR